MTVNEWIKEIHDNAVNHGWWETDRPFYETAALIHSELSEALEEARAGRPFVWHICRKDGETVCDGKEVPTWCFISNCGYEDDKPEGIAVELIDAVIRIFDYLGHIGAKTDPDYTLSAFIKFGAEEALADVQSVAAIVNAAHDLISYASMATTDDSRIAHLLEAAAGILLWIRRQGGYPEDLMEEKHAYNKTRPYRHGKKF